MAIETDVQRLRNRRTKIVATLGPATASPEQVEALARAGVDVFRLNMSHGSHADHHLACEHVRRAGEVLGRPCGVLADLGGPKIRVGTFADPEGIALDAGQAVTITVREVRGEPGLIPSGYDALAADVRPGDHVLLADGAMDVVVERVEGTEIRCTVVQGGRLTDRKGINLPGVRVSAPSLTAKDVADAEFAVALGVDFLALSFVRRADDIASLRALLERCAEPDEHPAIVAKIERPEALRNIEEILAATDAVMVARGDLGVELPPEQVPIAQRALIDGARARGKPVIVATQMLESMIDNARPTRAEVADVSHAVMSGADAVMLSGETASGRHPVEAVTMMDQVARHTEGYLWSQGAFGTLNRREDVRGPIPFGEAMARATALISRDLRVRGIMVLSENGTSAATMSAGRPAAPVVAISSRPRTFHRLSLLWGIVPVLVERSGLTDAPALARRLARTLQLAESGQFVLLVQGFHTDPVRSTPSVTLLRL